MYEKMTFANILKNALSNVSEDFDKRQGAIIYDALAPICAELAQVYIALDIVLKEGFADTANREYLIKRALERGLKPYEATYTVILAKLEGNIEIDGGERFSTEEGIIYFYTGEKEEEFFKLRCETKGEDGNISYGELLPLDNIPNLKNAKIHTIFLSARDEEDTEVFRKRYFDSLKNEAFGGNRADYIEKISQLNNIEKIIQNGGIGGIKVYRIFDGGGKVEIFITNNSFLVPTKELIEIVQEEIDPKEKLGEGFGIAPIGHFVTIKPAKGMLINIETELDLSPSYIIEDIEGYIEKAIEEYILDLAKTWQTESIIIRISHIESIILKIQGVLDIKNTKINGKVENLILEKNTIPLRGQINVN